MKRFASKLRSRFSSPPSQRSLYLVSDGAGWILDEVATQLAHHLPKELNASTVFDSAWTRSRHSLVHFISRDWAWSDQVLKGADRSNKYIGLWWHGKFGDASFDAALQRVPTLQNHLAAMQVPTSIAYDTMLQAGVPAEKLVLLPEGLDCSRFKPAASPAAKAELRARYGIPKDAFVIGSFQKDGVGWGDGMEPKLIKGPDTFASAMAILSKSHPVFVLIPGPARGYLRQRFEDDKVPYLGTGHIDNDSLAELYHALDVYVSPSRDEGGPAGVMEAMASGVPVVSTAAGVGVDLFEDDKNGLLVPIEDARALAAACERLLTDRDLYAKLSANGYQKIQANDWGILATQYYEQLYKPLLANN
jgi:glycosyltransferase involved in cell wall biosynthesis